MQLVDRWRSDPPFQGIMAAIVEGRPAAEWVPSCPVVQHTISRTDANDLRGIQLDGIQIGALDLSDSVLDYSRISGVSFNRTGLQWSCVSHVSFVGAKLVGVQALPLYGEGLFFSVCDLRACNFHESDLGGLTFERCSLAQVDFHSSRLRGSDLRQTTVRDTSFFGCVLDDSYVTASRFDACSFKMASLLNVDLNGVTFDNCDLSGVDLRGCDLKSAKFVGGNFGVVEHAGVLYRTKIYDIPQNRRAIELSGASRVEEIQWCAASGEGQHVSRIEGGKVCTKEGYWFTPAASNSLRYFKTGELMPVISSDYGLTLWQWDNSQRQ